MSLRRYPVASCLAFLVLAVPARAADDGFSLDLGSGARLEMVRVKAGKLLQGSPPAEQGRGDDEAQRQVTITRDYYIGRFEVTRGQFARFVQATGYRTEAEKGTSGGFGWDGHGLAQRPEFNWRNPGFAQTDDHPVVIVTYDDALAFVAWLSGKARRTVALPTEAQWEYAARAGSTSRFPGGDSEDDARAVAWLKANAGNGTRPVGQRKPNAWGLYDASGNVYEWCRDWYGPYGAGPVVDPEEMRSTLQDKPRRVLRGGSWLKDARACRLAARYRNTPGSRNADNGFRVVASVEETRPAAAGAPAAGGPGAQASTPAPPTTLARPASEEPGDLTALLVVGLLCVGTPLLVVILAMALVRRRAGLPTGYPDLTARLAEDGFWLNAPKVAQGSTIRYRVVVDGVPQSGEVVAERGPAGKGQFVYTGGKPSAVEVIGVVVAAGLVGAGLGAIRPAPESPRRPARTMDEDMTPPSRPFRGHPSAY